MHNQSNPHETDQQRFMREVYGKVEARGQWYFRRKGYKGEALEDAIQEAHGLAWKCWAANEKARENPWPLAIFACRQVADGRSLDGIILGRSFDGRGARKRGIGRAKLEDYCSYRDEPSAIAQFRIDVPAWLASLNPALRETALRLILDNGERGRVIAGRLLISHGRLSQRRKELRQRWEEYTA